MTTKTYKLPQPTLCVVNRKYKHKKTKRNPNTFTHAFISTETKWPFKLTQIDFLNNVKWIHKKIKSIKPILFEETGKIEEHRGSRSQMYTAMDRQIRFSNF